MEGRGHFARVSVAAEPVAPTGALVRYDLDASGLNEARAAHWVEAAVDGARTILSLLVPEGGTCLVITLIQGHPADTREDSVWCASALAPWRALGPTNTEPELVFLEGRWRLLTRQGKRLDPRVGA